jgi:hypothetical protein
MAQNLVDISELIVALREAAHVGDGDELRPGLAAAERQLMLLLNALSVEPELQISRSLKPLMVLHGALVDLANGQQPEMLTPLRKPAGRPEKDVASVFLQAMAARTLSELFEGGEALAVAAGRVAKALRGMKGNPTTTTVKNWRARLEEGPGGSGMPRDAWEQYVAPLPPGLGSTPKERGENLLKALRERGSLIG